MHPVHSNSRKLEQDLQKRADLAGGSAGTLTWDKEDTLHLQELTALIFSVLLFQLHSSFLPLFIIVIFFLNCAYIFTLAKFSFVRYFYGNT